uniref:Glutaminyl-peptide cyclotransferase-like isoform X2 n=1 Tax=Nicotiana sylvestris TaxID=4096 RepID=A0A1U7WCY8_NICSY|nr:PREDICTED: glutaminyl-peptide cyclotransferase-like isoform X2 [Nicotiana sylvestris]
MMFTANSLAGKRDFPCADHFVLISFANPNFLTLRSWRKVVKELRSGVVMALTVIFEKFSHGMPDGWGLATDGKVLFGSDGSSTLYQIDPQTMKVVKKQIVNYQGDEVHRLNELEYVYDEVWANIWMTDCIARISHKDGSVLGWILLHNLREGLLHNLKQIDVLNGIAWDRDGDRLFVTGKWWPKLYEIKLHPLKTPFNGDIKQICMPPAFPFS